MTPFSYLSDAIYIDLSDPNANWVQMTPMPAARNMFRAVSYKNSIYTVGGENNLSATFSNTWRLRTNDNPEDISQLTSLGRTILLKFDRYGYTAGRPMRILNSTSDHAQRMITLQVWG